MIKVEDVYRIGIINKPHGVHGELLFTFDDDIFDRVEADYIICMMDGILVPFFLGGVGHHRGGRLFFIFVTIFVT